MYETADSVPSSISLPPEAKKRFRELAEAIDARSQIVWAEHCTECGYPDCYSSCAFYTPRRDRNCRRFADGINQTWLEGTSLGRIRFGRWAKLEGVGPVALVSPDLAARRDAVDRYASGLISATEMSSWIYSHAARRWNGWKVKRSAGSIADDASGFVMEAWCETKPSEALILSIAPTTENRVGFQFRIELEQGYNRAFAPRADIAAHIDLQSGFSIRIAPAGDSANCEVVFGLMDFVRFKNGIPLDPCIVGGVARQARNRPSKDPDERPVKCVVWDLDNALWRGTLAEDGQAALTLDSNVVSTIEELDRRGILQSVASKNDAEPAMSALQAFGLREYFLFPQIGWGPKSASLKRIAESLDIGLDSFVFVDDQAFERGEVGETLPEVTVISETQVSRLLANPRIAASATAESRKRRTMYKAEERRQASFLDSGADYLSFLRGCGIEIEIESLSEAGVERAYELAQRTNQLNVSGNRHSRDEIRAMLRPDSTQHAIMFGCRDRFGEYGVVGMCVLDRRSPRIRSFMMSCRVQRKRVECAFFSWLSRRLRERREGDELTIDFRRTGRNQPVVRMLEDLGFAYFAEGDGRGIFVRPIDRPFAEDDIVRIVDRTRMNPLVAKRPRIGAVS
jgi:FkbH-like protein